MSVFVISYTVKHLALIKSLSERYHAVKAFFSIINFSECFSLTWMFSFAF